MTTLLLTAVALASDADIMAAALSDSRSPDYDAPIAEAIVATYDRNRSGDIDSMKEFKAISCQVWTVLDAQVRVGWDGTGFRGIYGFEPELIWVGYAWGIDEKLRAPANKWLAKKCSV